MLGVHCLSSGVVGLNGQNTDEGGLPLDNPGDTSAPAVYWSG